MAKLVQCVPNFSEGRRQDVIDAIVGAMKEVEGVKVVEASSDPTHNRLVVGLLGAPGPVAEAVFRGCATATELIDMEIHQGEHPRIGATDVIPFVPVAGVEMEECITLARQVGERISRELEIPVYYYEEAALKPERRNLAHVRRGQYEALKEEISKPERGPDVGPAKMHPRAGATAVGARHPLIAFNVNLGTERVEVAKTIARAIRARNGGFTQVKAIGLALPDRGQVQVSMNMCNYRETPLHRVLETIRSEARRWGVPVVGTEIVGTLPQEALLDALSFYLQLEEFHQEQVLENHLIGGDSGED